MQLLDLKSNLSTKILKITFKKKNGDIRIMECTKNLDLIPPSRWPKSTNEEDEQKAIRVYDIKAQDWRSFLFENVIEVS